MVDKLRSGMGRRYGFRWPKPDVHLYGQFLQLKEMFFAKAYRPGVKMRSHKRHVKELCGWIMMGVKARQGLDAQHRWPFCVNIDLD